MTYSLGVDLGTTFVAAAVARPRGSRWCRSGIRRWSRPRSSPCAPTAASSPGTPPSGARSASRRWWLGGQAPVGRSRTDQAGRVSYPVATLLGAQLRDVVTRVTDREGEAPERIVLTHPTTWTPTRRGAVRRGRASGRARGATAGHRRRGRRAPRRAEPVGRRRDRRGLRPRRRRLRGDGRAHRSRQRRRSWHLGGHRRASVAPTSTMRSCLTSTTPWAARSPGSTWTTGGRPWRWPDCGRTASWPRRPCPWTRRPSSPSSSPAGASRSGWTARPSSRCWCHRWSRHSSRCRVRSSRPG